LLFLSPQFGNETNDQTSHSHQAKALTQSEMEAIEARMMLRNWHLTERCAFYGLDQPGKVSLMSSHNPKQIPMYLVAHHQATIRYTNQILGNS
jgi:hypothetical protein